MPALEVDWRDDLERWLAPFLDALGHKTRRRMCPAYVAGLIGPGDRKSIQPMAAKAEDIGYDRLHHFIAAGAWDHAPLEAELWRQADALVGGGDSWLIIDDTALPKKGKSSVGVAPQYASALGKNANCMPGEEVWLVGEHRSSGERKYYLSNLPPHTPMKNSPAPSGRASCDDHASVPDRSMSLSQSSLPSSTQ